jgi:hypothetical protein
MYTHPTDISRVIQSGEGRRPPLPILNKIFKMRKSASLYDILRRIGFEPMIKKIYLQ